MAKSKQTSNEKVHFRCAHCKWIWETSEFKIEDDPESPWHPWAYFSTCPKCGEEDVPEQAIYKNIRKTYSKSTGPVTAEGKAKVGENLAGQADPRRIAISRLNGLMHGAYADTLVYFPARPGSKWCGECEVPHDVCVSKVACIKNTELLMRYLSAFQSQDPTQLRALRAQQFANVDVMLNMMIRNVVQNGAMLEKHDYYIDKESNTPIFMYDNNGREVKTFQANPLIDKITFLMSKLGITLQDSNMTERNLTSEEKLVGHLDGDESMTSLEYQQSRSKMLENLTTLVKSAQISRQKDPILLATQDYNQDV